MVSFERIKRNQKSGPYLKTMLTSAVVQKSDRMEVSRRAFNTGSFRT